MIPTTERALVSIYRSSIKQEMYLYVPKDTDLERMPQALMEHFGKPTLVMDLLLNRERKLARVDTGRVLDELAEKGFYLQMPPNHKDRMLNPNMNAAVKTKPGA